MSVSGLTKTREVTLHVRQKQELQICADVLICVCFSVSVLRAALR